MPNTTHPRTKVLWDNLPTYSFLKRLCMAFTRPNPRVVCQHSGALTSPSSNKLNWQENSIHVNRISDSLVTLTPTQSGALHPLGYLPGLIEGPDCGTNYVLPRSRDLTASIISSTVGLPDTFRYELANYHMSLFHTQGHDQAL